MKLIDNFDAEYEYVTNEDTVFTFKTNLDAPRYRLINIDFASPDQSRWRELIPQHDKDVIGEPPPRQEDASPARPPRRSVNGPSVPTVFATCTYSSYLFVCFLHDVKNVLKMYRLSSGEELRTFPLDVGSVVGFTGRKSDSEIFYYFTSFLSPGTPYRLTAESDSFLPTRTLSLS